MGMVNKKILNIKPIELSSTRDMSATWKMLGKGGIVKIKNCFCHCCDCISEEIQHHKSINCDVCEEFINNHPTWKDTWKCYHRQIMNNDYRAAIEEVYEALKEELKVSLDEISKTTKLVLISHDARESAANPFSIGFQPSTIE